MWELNPEAFSFAETKHIHGTVTVNGDIWKGVRGNPSQQAKNHARRIYQLLRNSYVIGSEMPYVEPIVVFSSKETKLIIEKNPERCKILQIKDIVDNSLYDYIMEYD